jgi:hypothetical protein
MTDGVPTIVKPPIVDGRSEAQVLAALRARLPGYLPGWQPAPGSPADAVHNVFAGFATILVHATNDALPRAQLAFLDACGEAQRPPQAATVTLVFTLADQSPVDAPLPAGMAVAAQKTSNTDSEPPSFVVKEQIAIARAKLAALYSVNPLEDRYDDHTPFLTKGFAPFENAGVVEHALYLGHDTLFKLPAGDAKLIVQSLLVDVKPPVREDLRLRWEYWSDSGWRPLAGQIVDLLITDQQADLRKEGGPATAAREILGRKSFWIRATLTDPLITNGGPSGYSLPVLDTVRVSLDYGRDNLLAEAVATDGQLVDATAPFQPFGASPVQGSTFYLGSSAAFGRAGANVRVDITLDGTPKTTNGTITFEYFTGQTWMPLSVGDTTNVFSRPNLSLAPPDRAPRNGVITFVAPPDWKPFTIGRASCHFLRARLDAPEVFGKAAYFTGNDFHPADWVPPRIGSLRISFSQVTAPVAVDHCLTSNGGVLADVTQAAQAPQSPFQPFAPVEDQQPAVYFGFTQRLPPGLVSLFVAVPPDPDGAPPDNSSPFLWEYRTENGWRELGVRDSTLGLRTSGYVQFVGPFDHVATDGPGESLYRIRARLKQGSRLPTQRIAGVWLNAVEARQASTYRAETVGRGTGEPRQLVVFPKTRVPVLEGEQIDIREWTGRDRGYEAITETVGESDRRTVSDPLTGQIIEVWVRWKERPHLFDTHPGDRVYTLDRVGGLLRFGDGRRGFVPPAGAPIVASFSTGGGLLGNVPADTVTEPRAAIPFLGSVTNPRPARGGSDAELPETTRLRGAHRLRHRGSALAPADFEWLAVQASPAVARARCLPVTGDAGSVQRGWVTVVIVPNSADPRPQPDDELIARVRAYLRDRAPATLTDRIRVIGPDYLPVSVVAEIVPTRPDEAQSVETAVRKRLNDFLHPLRGGRDGRGWQVGQGVPLSQVAAFVEGTPGVDFARELGLRVEDAVYGDEVPGRPDKLVAPGEHELRLTLRGEAC